MSYDWLEHAEALLNDMITSHVGDLLQGWKDILDMAQENVAALEEMYKQEREDKHQRIANMPSNELLELLAEDEAAGPWSDLGAMYVNEEGLTERDGDL